MLAFANFLFRSSVCQANTGGAMNKIRIFGHRGMGCSGPGTPSRFPENSLSAFKESRRIGADGFELDVFLSKNDELLVLHGHTDKYNLCLTTLPRNGNSGKNLFSDSDLVETTDVKASELLLRKPWILLNDGKDGKDYLAEHKRDKDASLNNYLQCVEAYHGECVPTLEEVFQEFGDSVQYNIELKGTRPELGERVLELVAKYPKANVLISSFHWTPPELGDKNPHRGRILEQFPNGPIAVDLLRPLVNNKLGIPLGLLYSDWAGGLPSIERLVQCAESFNAQWVNVPHDFWKSDNPIIGSDLKGEMALNHLVEELHKRGLKVFSYFHETDLREDIQKQVDAKVDALCPNDVETAVQLTKNAEG